MKYIFDVSIALILASMLITTTMSKDMLLSFHWVGIALCVTIALSTSRWNDEEINKLKDEIKELKNKLKNYDTEY